jgi:outer membrane biosynthesis protein TonB
MNLSERSATLAILIVAALVLAILVGLLIPLASNGLPGQELTQWTPPAPTIAPSGTPVSVRETSPAPTQIPTRTSVPSPAPTEVAPTETIVEPSPTATETVALSTMTPSPSATATPEPEPTQTPADAPVAVVKLDPLSVRQGPSTDATIITRARSGDTFTVLGRSADDAWLKVCCVDEAPAWLAAEFVEVSVPVTSLPVVEP